MASFYWLLASIRYRGQDQEPWLLAYTTNDDLNSLWISNSTLADQHEL